MRRMLAIVVCKLLRFAGKLLGRGSSLPGQFALKVCPDVLGRVKLPSHIIAVGSQDGGDHLHCGGLPVGPGDGDDVGG